jgi:hypothetical protein
MRIGSHERIRCRMYASVHLRIRKHPSTHASAQGTRVQPAVQYRAFLGT